MGAELRVREPVEAESSAIATLLNDHARALFGESELTEREIRHWFTLPNLWFRVAEQDEQLVGYVDVQDEQAEGTRFDLDVRTRDAEAARALLAAGERQARTSAKPGGRVRGYASSADGILTQAYDDAGFAVVRHSFQMRIDLEGDPPEPEWPSGIVVRTMRPGEEERVYEANEEAFEDHWDYRRTPFAEWRRWTLDHPQFDPALWFLALAEDEIAGVSLCSWHSSGDPHFGWVASLGVRRPWRRRGLGLALLRHSFAELAHRGATRVGLGVDGKNTTGAVRLYERAGMRVARRTDMFEKLL